MTRPPKRPDKPAASRSGRPLSDDAELPFSRTPRVEDDVRGEMEFHIRERAKELEALGMPPEQAAAEAAALFGDRADVEAQCRDLEQRRRVQKRQSFAWHTLGQDIMGGLRLLRKSPLFAGAAILTLAIGIGANSAVFSLVNEVILQPLNFPQAHRLVRITEQHESGWGNLAWSTALEVREQSQSLSDLAAYGSGATTVLGTSSPIRVQAASVSQGFYEVFGVQPERGRLPFANEHALGATPVTLVSHGFWRDQLGAPENLAGVQITMDRVYDVVGVLPASFDFPKATQVWTPAELDRQSLSHTAHNYEVTGKLRPDISPAAAQQELSALLARMAERYAPDFDAVGATVAPLQDVLTADLRTPLYLLFAASTVLLLAACTNVASAQMARGAARQAELAVRSALGASRLRLVRQLLTESVVLSLIGSVCGLILARILLIGFARTAPASLAVDHVSMDLWVLSFTVGVALLSALGFGLYPALRLSDSNTTQALREGGRGTVGRSGMRVWHALVATEIAVAVMLLAGSQLLIRSFAEVMRTDFGFDVDNVSTANVDLPTALYTSDGSAIPQFHSQVLSRLEALPGVQSAGFVTNRLPLTGVGMSGSLEVEGKPLSDRGAFNGYAVYRVVGGQYFEAMGIRLLGGRLLEPRDDALAPPVVVVDSVFAAEQWPGEDVVGRRLRPYGMDSETEPWATVVGVVASVRAGSATEPFRATYYFDHRQRVPWRASSVSYAVRSTLPPADVAGLFRRELQAVDPQVPVEPSSMSRVLADTVAVQRFMMQLLGAFAAMALLLALVGIYAVVSFSVARRTREIGIRLALGSSTADVLRLVMRTSMRGVVPGLIAGALLAMAATRSLRSLLYGVSPSDPLALIVAVAILATVGVAATLIPARRAARVDPLVAMRAD